MAGSGGTGGPYTFAATGLPAGLTISTSGTISGTPTVSGTFSYTVTVTDAAGHSGTVNCSVTVAPPVSATCVSITAVQGFPITAGDDGARFRAARADRIRSQQRDCRPGFELFRPPERSRDGDGERDVQLHGDGHRYGRA